MLIVNQQHHELLISYYQHKLRSLPDGYFGVYKNKKAVYITRDPNDKNITPKSKRRLFIETQEGQIYTKLIEETLHIKAKLHYLEEIWKATYWKDSRSINFPLNKRCSGNLTKERFFQSKEMQNPILTDRKAINYNDRILRSKNELIVCRELDNWGYEYKVEIDLSSDGFTELYPDATFYVPEIEKPIAVETDGAMDKESYMNKSETRKFNYLNSGFVEFKDIVFLRLTDKTQFDSQRFSDLISAAIFCNLSDIII